MDKLQAEAYNATKIDLHKSAYELYADVSGKCGSPESTKLNGPPVKNQKTTSTKKHMAMIIGSERAEVSKTSFCILQSIHEVLWLAGRQTVAAHDAVIIWR